MYYKSNCLINDAKGGMRTGGHGFTSARTWFGHGFRSARTQFGHGFRMLSGWSGMTYGAKTVTT